MRHVSVQAIVSFIIAFRESRFIDIVSTVTSTPSQRGTSRTYTLRRLKRDRPDQMRRSKYTARTMAMARLTMPAGNEATWERDSGPLFPGVGDDSRPERPMK
jgi:hypothetical protein